jgi:hypothetical protein
MKYYAELTNEEARAWLIRKDKEAAAFWRDTKSTDLANCVFDNIRDFGLDTEVSILKLVSIDGTWEAVETRGVSPLLLRVTPNTCCIMATDQTFSYTSHEDLEQKLIDRILNKATQ